MSSHDGTANTEAPAHAQPTASCAGKSPPDWSQIKHDIFCPLCGYSLRGLIEPCCPECGYRFDWDKMLDPNAAMHPYLFEYHPERNFWSYYRTVLGACRPKQFWTTLHPRQPSRPGRLLLYWMLGLCSLPLLEGCFMIGSAAINMNIWRVALRDDTLLLSSNYGTAWQRQVPPGTLSATFRDLFADPTVKNWVNDYLIRLADVGFPPPFTMACAILWPWLTLAALMIFRVSMRKAKVRTIHLLRCVIYSFDLQAWAILMMFPWLLLSLCSFLALLCKSDRFIPLLSFGEEPRGYGSTWIVAAGVVYSSFRLTAACRLYLKLPHPRSTVLATQIVTLLSILTVTIVVALAVAPQGLEDIIPLHQY